MYSVVKGRAIKVS